MNHRQLQVNDVEPLRAEIVSFIEAVQDQMPSPVSGIDGRNALALALRVLEQIEEHAKRSGFAAAEIASS